MLQAVLFDQDGVIIDTERFGHRVAFNKAFAALGYPNIHWDENLYHQLLQIAGGKERIRHYFARHYRGANKPADIDGFAKEMHKVKTDIFTSMLPDMPLRPGVRRVMRELNANGVALGICTTSNERAAKMMAEEILIDIRFDVVIAGDMVKRKKPDPEIYLDALRKLDVDPEATLVVEDSHIGVQAARAAGCWVLATYTGYTESEDLSPADFIVNSLGDPRGEKTVVRKEAFPIAPNGYVKVENILRGL